MFKSVILCILLGSCLQKSTSKINAPVDAAGEFEGRILPDNFRLLTGFRLVDRLQDLKRRAILSDIPYSGSMYPSNEGGADVDGALSRYDRANGTSAVSWERASGLHITAMKTASNEWYGHCNGFASASTRHVEPKLPVLRNGVTFSPSDIKALLAEVYMSGRHVSLSGVQCKTPLSVVNRDPFVRKDPTKMNPCEDTNPANFHLALSNFLGGPNPMPFVIELGTDVQIWNYPVYGYSCDNCVNDQWREVNTSQALAILGGSGTKYKFNPDAKRFFDVAMTVSMADRVLRESVGVRKQLAEKFRYILETDQEGKILGGEWAAESRAKIPDFIWMALDPVTNQSDDKRRANAQVDHETVFAMWRESLGSDAQTFEPVRSPSWAYTWGYNFDFQASINESRSGVFFTGRPAKFQLDLTSEVWKGASVELSYDGVIVGSRTISDSTSFMLPVTRSGHGQLSVTIKKGSRNESFVLPVYSL